MNDGIDNLQSGYRNVTSSINENKSSNALKNTDAIIPMLVLHLAAHIGGGTNDNANDAHKELEVTFASNTSRWS
ncbi:hypothetical protein QTG54_014112 [Skeletonema marinoi]|uniref:Uncharacterized protein n=1 Tax=Skeletonema marinoi TaxID=267567 RepID=A0AAD8XXC9_9STRA|nr:hypothetical protein QTG54_014112 [Skeletonema marinoi]